MLFKNPVRTSKRTPHFTITKINWLTLFKFKSRSMSDLLGAPSIHQRYETGRQLQNFLLGGEPGGAGDCTVYRPVTLRAVQCRGHIRTPFI
jgi:hypothetical protein